MRRTGIWALRAVGIGAAVIAAFWAFGPRETVDREISFDPAAVGPDLDAYLAGREAAFGDITPGVEKRVIWAGAPGVQTALSVLYVHGFSATSEEIRPVPDDVARTLGANLVFTRLTGHGRGSAAMGDVAAGDWIEDMAEALEVARRAGREVIVIATSTGGTLAAIAATDAALNEAVKGIVFVSPNFGIRRSAAMMLNWPGIRWWGPLVAGAELGFQPINDNHRRYWTTRYPTRAVLPMAALVDHARRIDYAGVTVPALFLFSETDAVVSPEATRRIAQRWGADATLAPQVVPPGNDPYDHVLAGDILSPALTGPVVTRILEWVRAL